MLLILHFLFILEAFCLSQCLTYWIENFLWEYPIFSMFSLLHWNRNIHLNTHMHRGPVPFLQMISQGGTISEPLGRMGHLIGRKWALCDHVVMWSHTHDPLPVGSGIPSPLPLWTEGPGLEVFQKHLRATGWQKTCSLSVSRLDLYQLWRLRGEAILTLVAKLSRLPSVNRCQNAISYSYKKVLWATFKSCFLFEDQNVDNCDVSCRGFAVPSILCWKRSGEGLRERSVGEVPCSVTCPGNTLIPKRSILWNSRTILVFTMQLESKDSALVDSVKMVLPTFVRSYLTATFVGWVEIYHSRVLNHSRAEPWVEMV